MIMTITCYNFRTSSWFDMFRVQSQQFSVDAMLQPFYRTDDYVIDPRLLQPDIHRDHHLDALWRLG